MRAGAQPHRRVRESPQASQSVRTRMRGRDGGSRAGGMRVAPALGRSARSTRNACAAACHHHRKLTEKGTELRAQHSSAGCSETKWALGAAVPLSRPADATAPGRPRGNKGRGGAGRGQLQEPSGSSSPPRPAPPRRGAAPGCHTPAARSPDSCREGGAGRPSGRMDGAAASAARGRGAGPGALR